jgi:hypothetical protein
MFVPRQWPFANSGNSSIRPRDGAGGTDRACCLNNEVASTDLAIVPIDASNIF